MKQVETYTIDSSETMDFLASLPSTSTVVAYGMSASTTVLTVEHDTDSEEYESAYDVADMYRDEE